MGIKAATVINIILATRMNGLLEKIREINVMKAKFKYKMTGPIIDIAGPNITKPCPI